MANPLKKYRDDHGLTQQGLAEFLGCSRGLVSLIESGARAITPENADAWASKLRLPREKLCPIFRRAA